jgi:hypothetical protein
MKGDTLPPSAIPGTSTRGNNEGRREIIERGLLARDAAKASRVYVSADAMLARLDDSLSRAMRRTERPPPYCKP